MATLNSQRVTLTISLSHKRESLTTDFNGGIYLLAAKWERQAQWKHSFFSTKLDGTHGGFTMAKFET